jgi:hypothetical protein
LLRLGAPKYEEAFLYFAAMKENVAKTENKLKGNIFGLNFCFREEVGIT